MPLVEPPRPSAAQGKSTGALQRRASANIGEDGAAIGAPLFTDARLDGNAGNPAVTHGGRPTQSSGRMGIGPIKNLLLEDLKKATKRVALAICELLAAQSRKPISHLFQHVAGTADGADRIGLGAAHKGPAQASDVNIDRSLVYLGGVAPDPIEQL